MIRSKERGAVIVTPSGYYFSYWTLVPSMGWDGWDSYHYMPEFTKDSKRAYVYEDERFGAKVPP